MRVLCAAVPMYSHALPVVHLGAELRRLGHTVAVALAPSLAAKLPSLDIQQDLPERAPLQRGRRGSLRTFFGEEVPRCASIQWPLLQEMARSFAPDLIVADFSCYAASIVAQRLDLPLVVTVPQSTRHHPLVELRHGWAMWVNEALAVPQREAGVQPMGWPLRGSLSTVVLGPPSLGGRGPNELHAAVLHPTGDPSARQPGAAVLTLGTAEKEPKLLKRLCRLLADRFDRLMVTGPCPASGLPSPVDWRPWHPLAERNPQVDLVVCHGGWTTLCEAFLGATPVICVPRGYDQHLNARLVVSHGLGRALTVRATDEEVLCALAAVRSEPYTRRLQAVQDEMAGLLTGEQVARRIQELC